jgi:hypothetical protein
MLALETDTAVSLADPKYQSFLRHTIAKKLNAIFHKYKAFNYRNLQYDRGFRTLKSIIDKLDSNNLIITRPDKGKTIMNIMIK